MYTVQSWKLGMASFSQSPEPDFSYTVNIQVQDTAGMLVTRSDLALETSQNRVWVVLVSVLGSAMPVLALVLFSS